MSARRLVTAGWNAINSIDQRVFVTDHLKGCFLFFLNNGRLVLAQYHIGFAARSFTGKDCNA